MHFYARFPTHRRFYAMSVSELRATNLSKLFHATIKGDKPITTKTFQQFLESIYTQTNKSVCIHKLISETHGLSSLQTSIWFKLSADFCNGDAAKLLRYLSSPDILTLADGTMLRDILKAVVSPAIFWDYLVKMFMEGRLDSEGQFGLAWLLCQVIYLLPPDDNAPFRDFASKVSVIEPMMASSDIEIRNLAHRIRHKVSGYDLGATSDDQAGPGGRHDNDFVNFREISIIPTADEVRSTDPAFIRPSNMFEDEATRENRHGMYLDNQFRLLREDMLYEIREELRVDAKRKNSRNPQLTGLTLVNVHYQPEDKTRRRRGIRWGIVLRCKDDLWQFQRAKLSKPEKRKDWLQDNRNFLKHQSIACLKLENELVALTTIERDEDLLVRNPPEIALHIEGAASIIRALVKLKTAASITLIQINTAIFTYHPILKAIQETKDVPLEHELLFWDYGKQQQPLDVMPSHIVDSLRQNPSQDLQSLLGLAKSVKLDDSQSASLLEGLTKTVSLIQGPPGTGKSFIGALLAKSLQSFAEQKILVVCYTNHALDQFLEDLMDIGIPESDMVRLGGKSSDRTKCLTLQQHPNLRGRLSRNDWTRINLLQEKTRQLDQSLRTAADHYYQASIKDSEIMVYLEFDQSNEEYFDAFSVPKASEKGMKTVGRGGKSISEFYLLNRWSIGRDAGTFVKHPVAKNAARVWSLPSSARQAKLAEWKEAILHEQATLLQKLVQEYDQAQRELDAIFDSKDRQILNSVQIIGCTTTAAAMFRDHITAASPNLLLVEEAGEILESHILTALSQTVKQLILIGDHKQLRPKVQSYELTIEKGEGYDLNRSLFERLVLKKYPHTTLTQQHRMRPEISALVRLLTYPDLKDAPSTIGRDDVRGLRMNVVFIQHSRPEEDNAEFDHILEKTETSHKLSKRNPHEVQMVLKILKYMGQQGYRTDQIIILTPYLGQLRALRQALSKDNDPVLNDLDTHDLVTAGLMDPKAAQVAKKSIRLATIDNYQGEESDIVIASLTRSNKERKIGFMSQEQRVNVLLSRARLGLIIIGDSETFLHAKAPTNVWENLIKYLKQNNNICSGLPVQCEKHPDKIADLETPDDFDTKCPGGGCTGPCGALLACKKHVCPSKCHQISDHSKMKCLYLFQDNCPQGHSRRWECHAGPPDPCPSCEEKSKLAEKMNRLAFLAQERRDKKERDHNQKMAAIDDQIKEKHDALRDKHLEAEQKRALAEKEQELSYLSGSHTKTTPSSHGNSSSRPSGVSLQAPTSSSSNQGSNNDVVQDTPPETSVSHQQGDVSGPRNSMEKKLSPAEAEWLRQKQVEGANNDAIDKIMSLGGLEKVKQGILDIKARVEVAQSQGTSIKEDRFSVAMLGNPGTGKTTVVGLQNAVFQNY
ncbi:hypothetical protein FRC14_001737 [Serendipita sp. 396]|nr:hypothetical protein FRC14_001737 [Serendipita sp. 396]